MKLFIVCMLFCSLFLGCATEPQPTPVPTEPTDFIKDLTCKKDSAGAYTGEAQPIAISLVGIAIQMGAAKFGQNVSSDEAQAIARAALEFYCSGKIDDIFDVIKLELRSRKISEIQISYTISLLKEKK